jgi:uncharacterized membrane protein YjfL (UPF0719 family)
MQELIRPLLTSVVFSVVGIVALLVAARVFVRISPFSLRKEIEEDQNVALAIIIGAVILGMSIIVAASIHG